MEPCSAAELTYNNSWKVTYTNCTDFLGCQNLSDQVSSLLLLTLRKPDRLKQYVCLTIESIYSTYTYLFEGRCYHSYLRHKATAGINLHTI
jgi:hypothetical protein